LERYLREPHQGTEMLPVELIGWMLKAYRTTTNRKVSGNLFVYNFDPLVDYLSGKPVDRDVHPVTLLALDNKAIPEACSIRRVAPALRDHINHQIPSPRLIRLPERTCDRLALCLWHGRPQSCFACDQIYQARSIHERCGACGQYQACGDAICHWRRQRGR
jgi:hypothetical protein